MKIDRIDLFPLRCLRQCQCRINMDKGIQIGSGDALQIMLRQFRG